MPLYEYQCDECAHRFEVIQKFSDAPIEVCPKCGGPVKKLLSSPAIQFKGSGWYITDYARKGGGGESKAEGGAATDTSASSDKSEKAEKSEKSEKSEKPAAASSPESGKKTTASPKAAADPVK